VRADDALAESLEPDPRPAHAGRLRVPARRHGITVGSKLLIEVSFGALSDEILLEGIVEEIETGDDRSYVVRIVDAHHERFDYVRAVLAQERSPIVRRYRRVAYEAPVQWRQRGRARRGRIADISCGGVFVIDPTPPPLGTRLDLRLHLPDHALDIEAEVTWAGQARGDRGFGVRFRGLAREGFERIREIVADRELHQV
jgi:hypothetical protein